MIGLGLFGERLAVTEQRLSHICAVHRGQDDDLDPDDLMTLPGGTDWPSEEHLALLAAEGDRLAHVMRTFGLSAPEADLLTTCLLPETNPLWGAAFRALNEMPTSRPTVAAALALLGIPVTDALVDGLLRAGTPLMKSGLVTLQNAQAPFPEQVLSPIDWLLDYLTGRETGAAETVPWLQRLPPLHDAEGNTGSAELRAALAEDPHQPRYLRQSIHGEALPAARAALTECRLAATLFDVEAAPSDDAVSDIARQAALRARLFGAAIIVPVPPDSDAASPHAPLLKELIVHLTREGVPLLLYGAHPWSVSAWEIPAPAEFDLRPPQRRGPRHEAGSTAAATADRIHRTAALAGSTSRMRDVHQAISQRAAADLSGLARHVVPDVDRDDLVLPPELRARLDLLITRVRHRDTVLPGLRRGGGRGHGITALFTGESGTGKTMAAEALAHELGLDLYLVSLPAIVSKYIGETEKNLERIFTAADALNTVVLFDEADSVFSKRTDTKNSNDRHANMQSGYLLQRLETFNGLAILTTNLQSNIDTAFTRRFDEILHFTIPDTGTRTALWHALLNGTPVTSAHAGTDRTPVDTDGDRGAGDVTADTIADLAHAYDLSGGNIRASIETAVFHAAHHGRPITRRDLLHGIHAQYDKLGRLYSPPNDGRYEDEP